MDELISRKETLEKELNRVENELQITVYGSEEYHKLYKKKIEIVDKIDEICFEILFRQEPAASDEIIDLRSSSDTKNYLIFLHNTNKIIGYIDYSSYHMSDYYGDIGYEIDEAYRGNGYAYNALVLISDILYKSGIPDFWISTYTNNYASLKTIEKYGGVVKETDYEGQILYECETRSISKSLK